MKHLDLFSGIGGFSLAVDRVWPEVEHEFCEIDPFCQQVLKKHWPHAKIHGDIKTLTAGPADLVTGGFPCQDISNARTWTTQGEHVEQGIRGTRSGLWTEMARVIKETRPKFVVAENVEALASKGLRTVLRDLHEIGYDAEWDIISAAYVGAPHQRKRLFIVAYPIGLGREQAGFIFRRITSQTIRRTSQWEPSGTVCEETGKKTLPRSIGVDDGLPAGLDKRERLKSLGNSIVPQVAEEIFRTINITSL